MNVDTGKSMKVSDVMYNNRRIIEMEKKPEVTQRNIKSRKITASAPIKCCFTVIPAGLNALIFSRHGGLNYAAPGYPTPAGFFMSRVVVWKMCPV